MSAIASDDELAGGIRTVVNRLSHVLRYPVVARGVTPTRLSALVTLERIGPLRSGDLAARMGCTAAAMSRLAESLLEGGWVDKDPDPADRRAWLLSINENGHALLDDLRRENTSELADDIRALSSEQRAVLAAALPVLTELADRHFEDQSRG